MLRCEGLTHEFAAAQARIMKPQGTARGRRCGPSCRSRLPCTPPSSGASWNQCPPPQVHTSCRGLPPPLMNTLLMSLAALCTIGNLVLGGFYGGGHRCCT